MRSFSFFPVVNKQPFLAVLLFFSTCIQAQGFGIYDARALALGGTSVALADTSHAQFYNPALLSFHDGREEKTNDGRFYFPMITGQISDALSDLVDIDDDDLEQEITDSVNAFNADQSTVNANAVLLSSEQLLDAITQVDGQDATVDSFFGLSVAEPADREGGAFYLGVRAIGGGRPDITDADLALLEDYTEALEFVASGGQQGEAHPELFNGDGTLIDPTDNLTSTATARGAAILEFGVSLSREFTLSDTKLALGITPKLVMIRTYEATQTVNGGGINSESNDEGFRTMNADIGLAAEIVEHVRFGISVKDVISKEFDTELGGSVRISPKPRFGIAYVSDRLQLGLDYDLKLSEPVGTESAIQEVTLGAEWQVAEPIYLRAGYRHDAEKSRDDILSAGVGLEFRNLLFDLTYSSSSDGQAFALQMGHAF